MGKQDHQIRDYLRRIIKYHISIAKEICLGGKTMTIFNLIIFIFILEQLFPWEDLGFDSSSVKWWLI